MVACRSLETNGLRSGALATPRCALVLPNSASLAGTGLTQQDFMQRDECLVVDEADNIIGNANKHDCHRFTPEQVRNRG